MRRKRIVIIDADAAFRARVAALMSERDVDVEDFSDCGAASPWISEIVEKGEGIDALIVEATDGMDLVERLRERRIAIPTMIVTADKSRALAVDALRLGCREFIDKPLIEDDFVRRLDAMLDSKGRLSTDYHTRKIRESTDTEKIKIDRVVGNYRLLKVLGIGAGGAVYLCERVETGEKFAMKRLKLTAGDDERATIALRRFINESRAIAGLKHPNIVKFVEFGQDVEAGEAAPYIVMEYVEGMSLREHIVKRDALNMNQRVSIMIQVGEALDAVHEAGLLHRDVKPENILVDAALTVKMTDFGLCRLPRSNLTALDDFLGTPGYLAPEYIERGLSTPRTDLFAFGVVCYELAVGVRPFPGAAFQTVINRILNELPVDPRAVDSSVSDALADVLARLLRKNPDKRFQSAAAVVEALRESLEVADDDRKSHRKRMWSPLRGRDWK